MMTKKISSNITKWCVLGGSLASIIFSLLLIYSPAVSAFGGVDAMCDGNVRVSCSGLKCSAEDKKGCSCTDEHGKVVDSKSCPRVSELEEVGGGY
jgi:hypothetical protein